MNARFPVVLGCRPAEPVTTQGLPGKAIIERGRRGSSNATQVFIANDDAATRSALLQALAAAGGRALVCSCPFDLVDVYAAAERACLLLGTRAWGRSGLDICDVLAAWQTNVPFIFFVHRHDVPGAVRALRKGAVNVLAPPFSDLSLLQNVEDALRRDEWLRLQSKSRAETTRRLSRLSDREREILDLVVAGRGNKEIARALGIVRRTMGFHLANVMRKMKVETVAELVRAILVYQDHSAANNPSRADPGHRVEA